LELLTKPQINILDTGKEYKILKVTGVKGTQIASHLCTKEAIIIILKGAALLKLGDVEILLNSDESAIIPASVPHALFIKENLTANVIMSVDSEIKFINN
jgi:quercetin dioxygenase-like cupin family protein